MQGGEKGVAKKPIFLYVHRMTIEDLIAVPTYKHDVESCSDCFVYQNDLAYSLCNEKKCDPASSSVCLVLIPRNENAYRKDKV